MRRVRGDSSAIPNARARAAGAGWWSLSRGLELRAGFVFVGFPALAADFVAVNAAADRCVDGLQFAVSRALVQGCHVDAQNAASGGEGVDRLVWKLGGGDPTARGRPPLRSTIRLRMFSPEISSTEFRNLVEERGYRRRWG
jgi:hypothetical protein